uniref:DND microRNA-mediated repression inhibitor 1 n=1 Tax=Podarcis muralis TaxID=64176 RepID=A0A670IM21_PODMU
RQSRCDSELPNEEVNQAKKTALLAWVEETGIKLVQINGQRKYGGPPPGWTGSVPPPGSEIFIGKIPQDIYEDKLIPLFQSVGRLYEFRLMMTFSGLNRGFAYAKYANRRSAQDAIAVLNAFEIQAGHPILVCRSTDKCELSIDGLSLSVREGHLIPMLQELTAGVLSVSLHPSPFRRERQLAEVKYSSHQAAAIARKALVEGLSHKYSSKVSCTVGNRGWEHGVQLALHLGSVLDYLNLQCKERQLGLPVFLTKCMQKNPEGWLQFWYQVVIPKYPSPFSGFIWIKPERSGLEAHEKAKNAVALQLLKALGKFRIPAAG